MGHPNLQLMMKQSETAEINGGHQRPDIGINYKHQPEILNNSQNLSEITRNCKF